MPHDLLYPGDPLAEHKSEILDWIGAVSGEKVPRDLPFDEVLKDGVILCNMMNKLHPGSVKQINKTGDDGQLTENIVHFQQAMREFGVPDDDIFQTEDLFEAKNIKQVVDSLAALANIASHKPGYKGPQMSPKAPVLFQWEEHEPPVIETPGTSSTGSGKKTSDVIIDTGNQQQQTILD